MLVSTIHSVAAAVGTRVFIEKITRRSTWQAEVADNLSKANFLQFRQRAEQNGQVMATEPLRVPAALVRWIANPTVREDLASLILKDLARSHPIVGFS